MRRSHAATGSALFFVLAPANVAGTVPWLLTHWSVDQEWGTSVRVVGGLLTVAGGSLLVPAFVRFAVEGLGTPAPVAPTDHLVVGGIYRHVRNPMYVGLLSAILGQALLLGQPVLLGYGFVVGVAVVSFVRLYEEPTLRARYGDAYRDYCSAVPGWWPVWRRRSDSR